MQHTQFFYSLFIHSCINIFFFFSFHLGCFFVQFLAIHSNWWWYVMLIIYRQHANSYIMYTFIIIIIIIKHILHDVYWSNMATEPISLSAHMLFVRTCCDIQTDRMSEEKKIHENLQNMYTIHTSSHHQPQQRRWRRRKTLFILYNKVGYHYYYYYCYHHIIVYI